MAVMKNNHRVGRPRKKPNTAIMKVVYDAGMSSYSVGKKGLISYGTLINASKENIDRLSLQFFKRLSASLGEPGDKNTLKLIARLMKLQKMPQYKPMYEKRTVKGYRRKK